MPWYLRSGDKPQIMPSARKVGRFRSPWRTQAMLKPFDRQPLRRQLVAEDPGAQGGHGGIRRGDRLGQPAGMAQGGHHRGTGIPARSAQGRQLKGGPRPSGHPVDQC